jgi:hypothetical protein
LLWTHLKKLDCLERIFLRVSGAGIEPRFSFGTLFAVEAPVGGREVRLGADSRLPSIWASAAAGDRTIPS